MHHMLHTGSSDGVEGKVEGDTRVSVRVHESVEYRATVHPTPEGVPSAVEPQQDLNKGLTFPP